MNFNMKYWIDIGKIELILCKTSKMETIECECQTEKNELENGKYRIKNCISNWPEGVL